MALSTLLASLCLSLICCSIAFQQPILPAWSRKGIASRPSLTVCSSLVANHRLDNLEGSRCHLRIRDSKDISYKFVKGNGDFKISYEGKCSLPIRPSLFARFFGQTASALTLEMLSQIDSSGNRSLLRLIPSAAMNRSVRQ